MADLPDGTLRDWDDIAHEHEWDTLLLGNGLSQNIWEPFGYRKLYDEAKKGGRMTAADRKLFRGTPNFERVLGDLLTTIRVSRAYGLDTGVLRKRYSRLQVAMGEAVRAVHLDRDKVPMDTRRAVRRVMKRFQWVFTTSYDLLIYWAMACDGFDPFMDHFRYNNRCEFDPARASVPASRIPVYFLHGALHLIVGESGATWKRTQTTLRGLLQQFGRPVQGEPQARPLLVTEGSAQDKLDVIEGNVYLRHALDRLYERPLPVVVFGSSLSEHDSHLIDALNEHRRPVAVSMLPDGDEEVQAKQVDIFGRLDAAKPLLFYNAGTHPLGDSSLRVERA